MRSFILILIVSVALLSLVGCGGSSTKSAEPEKGSLMRTFKLIDEQGRESGALTLDPQGGAELRDADGKLIKSFNQQQAAKAPVEKAVEEEAAASSDMDADDGNAKGDDVEKVE